MFTTDDYNKLHDLVFRQDYSGYKPTVTEIPNGDGKADADKRYAHVALKYLQTEQQKRDLLPYLERAHALSMRVALTLDDLSFAFWPDIRYGALRILDYPPGAVSNRHEDFDLFTLMLYRDQPDRFRSGEQLLFDGTEDPSSLATMRKINAQAHLGQIGAEVGLGPATPHEVLPSEKRQTSIVYFAIPDHDLALPSGVLVRDWLNERMARSRTEFKKYEAAA